MLALCAPDKFRGSLSADEAAAAMAAGAAEAGWEAIVHPLADGGEGTMAIIAGARRGRVIEVAAPDALGRPSSARLALLPDGTAIVEAAEAIGLGRLDPSERDVMAASSAGFGVLVTAALDAAATRLVLCLGGSATVDGGLGLLRVLGVDLRDRDGVRLEGSGADLLRLATVDRSRLDPRLAACELVLALDVLSPLVGPSGAAPVFGPQKGASPEQVALLDEALARLGHLLGATALVPGAGAAGGLGAALAWLGATPCSGADIVMEETRFGDALRGAALVLTGEGKVDRQTAAGKTVARVVVASVAAGVPVCVIGGAVEDGAADALTAIGADAVVAASPPSTPILEALRDGGRNVRAAARALCSAGGGNRTRKSCLGGF